MGVGRRSPTRMDWSWALVWVLASGHLVPGSAAHHHYPSAGGTSTSWTVWGSRPISGSLGLKPIFGSWVVRPGVATILQPAAGSFASKPITGGISWGSNKPINTVTGTRPSGAGLGSTKVGLQLNSKWGPMAGTSAYRWSHSRPGSSSYQSVNFSYKMKPKPHPIYKPPTVVPTKPPPTLPPSPPPQPTLPPYKPPTQPTPTSPPSRPPPTTPPSTTPPTLPDFLLTPSPLLPLEDIDLPSGGAPTVLRPPSRLSPSSKPADPSRAPQSPFSPPCRPGLAPPCLPPNLSIFLP